MQKSKICPICNKEIDLTKQTAMYYPYSFELCHLDCIAQILKKEMPKQIKVEEYEGEEDNE